MKNWLLITLVLPFTLLAQPRIVTIGGDVTDIVYALGAGNEIVARDSTSTTPAQAAALPDIGYMRQLNAEGILAMKPTLVLASELAQPSLALKQIAESGVTVVSVTGKASLEAIDSKVATIADTLQRSPQGAILRATLKQQLAAINRQPLPVKVLFIMSHGGMTAMAAGQKTAADAAIRSAGLQNALQGVERYQPLSLEGVIASQPDLILLTNDGVKTLGGEANIWKLPGIAQTPAAKKRQLLVVDDMALLGFGPQTPAAISRLRQKAESL